MADSSVNFVVRPWVLNDDYWDLTESVKAQFDAEGVSIPFPQRDVHMISAEPDLGADEIRPAPRPQKNPSPSN